EEGGGVRAGRPGGAALAEDVEELVDGAVARAGRDAAEARRGAGMARRPARNDADHQRVTVAVLGDVHHLLRVAARGALVPQLVPAAAPEPRLTRFPRLRQRLLVHVGEREDRAAARVADDGGNETVR